MMEASVGMGQAAEIASLENDEYVLLTVLDLGV